MIFTVPFYFDESYVTFIDVLNNKNTKYKVRKAYNCLKYNSPESSGFENRASYNSIDDFISLENYISLLKKYSINFIYSMDMVSTISNGKFQSMIPKLELFFKRLISVGVNEVLVSNQMLADYASINFPSIKLHISTMMQVDSIGKARNLNNVFNCYSINPCTELNKDFDFIECFKSTIKDVNLELVANEGCIFSCPLKSFEHNLAGLEIISSNHKNCDYLLRTDIYEIIAKNKMIYPWELDIYEKFGADSIKLVEMNQDIEKTKKQITTYMNYKESQNNYLNSITSFYDDYIDLPLDFLKINSVPIDFYIVNRPKCREYCNINCNECNLTAAKLKEHITKVC